MADPITWGLINLVKKGVKGVQTTLDGVSDKVSGLTDSLDADFMEVKNAIEGVKTDVGNVNTSVDDIKSDTESLKVSIDGSTLFNADSVVKSVQSGVINEVRVTHPNAHKIKISKVNKEKSIIFVNGTGVDAIGKTLSPSISSDGQYLTLSWVSVSGGYINISLAWTVLEFY